MKKKISDKIEISHLLSKYVLGQHDKGDITKIQDWLNESPSHHHLLKEILNDENWKSRKELLDEIDLDHEWTRFESGTNFVRRKWNEIFKYAAIFLIPLAIGSYFLFQNLLVEQLNQPIVELVPGAKKAQLILSNGQRIELSGQDQQIETGETDVVVKNQNQALSYTSYGNGGEKEDLVYNQLLIGRGEEYQLILSDGTKVWLNSETKLKYPTQFASNIREVELEGEAYFEVTKNAQAPFIVKTRKIEVKVLGTKFSITAYHDDQTIKTTLLEGKVEVKPEEPEKEGSSIILAPDDQAIYNIFSRDVSVQVVDAKMFVAWTKGFFAFDEESLDQIMNRLSRWYNVDIIFKDDIARKSKFTGKLPRFEDCNVLLNMITKTTNIKFDVEKESNVITVSLRK